MIGGPVFLREVLAQARRPRTYLFQTVFLGVLVLGLIPMYAQAIGIGKSRLAEQARMLFEWGAYLQLIILTLIGPALVANAITEEKGKNTLDLLLLTEAGPWAIVWGKFCSRLYSLLFLLFLTVPLLFALLTLGGVAARSILITMAILGGFSVLATGLGIFLSTVLKRTPGVLGVSYAVLVAVLGAPKLAQLPPAQQPLVSPLLDLAYVANPTWYYPTASLATEWWVAPAWNVTAGLALVLLAGLALPHARELERLLDIRRALEAFDRATFLLLRPGRLLRRLTRGGAAAAGDDDGPRADPRPIGVMNPIYWKETNVNTVGRFKTWWRMNLAMLVGLLGSYALFQHELSNIEFHKVVAAVVTGFIVLLPTIIAASTVSREREDGTLDLLATTPLDCATYVMGKVRGIGRNIVFLAALPFVHVIIWIVGGVLDPTTLVFFALGIPVATAASIVQGIFVSLLFPTTLRAIVAAIVVVTIEAALPLVCCVPSFNLPLMAYYMVEPSQGLATALGQGPQGSFTLAKLFACLFSAGTHLGFLFVIYSLIRSDFDRYIGRAA
ncbi:MAG: ABC transporter permease subunit [Planctomycetota bacterium]|nr:ABC transporter permease subunit [Planctomycetota bacterium]